MAYLAFCLLFSQFISLSFDQKVNRSLVLKHTTILLVYVWSAANTQSILLALLKATLFSFRITFHASTGAAQLSAAIPDHLLRA